MKKLIILFLTGILSSYTLKAQCLYPGPNDVRADVSTPKGSNVVAWILEEDPLLVREYNDYRYIYSPITGYPNATPIITYDSLSSTAKFNCHGYAWLRVEEGIDRWIGTGFCPPYDITDPEKIYMTDGSYTKVSQHVYPGKVYWGGAGEDHSAITTSHPDTVISKWNAWPLMKHKWNDSPFHGSSKLEYYAKNCSLELKNEIITSNRTVTSCGDITLQNVTVTNGATLTLEAVGDINIQGVTVTNNSNLILDAGGDVNIITDIELGSGSEFEIL